MPSQAAKQPGRLDYEYNLMKLPTNKTQSGRKKRSQKKRRKIKLNLAMFIEFIFHIVAAAALSVCLAKKTV